MPRWRACRSIPRTTRGQVSGDFTFRTKLPPVYDPSLASIEVNATVANFAADHLVGKAGLEQGALAVTLADGIIHVAGTGKIFGAPATLEVTRDHSQPAQGVIAFPMDEAARAKAGLNFGTSVAGPIAVKIAGDVGAAPPRAQVDLDFVKTGLNDPVPGLFKPAGRAAKASFSYARGRARRVDPGQFRLRRLGSERQGRRCNWRRTAVWPGPGFPA